MAIPELRACPSAITAGDTLLFRIDNSSYPATEWLLSYSFRGDHLSRIDFFAQADGSNHVVNVSAIDTGTWMDGIYKGVGKFSNILDPSQVITIWQGTLQVKIDLSAESEIDTRSWAKKCLDSVEQVLSGKATKDVLNSTIAGQSIGRMTPDQLFALRDRFFTLYQQELAQECANQKKPQMSNIGITFVLPS
jgi:hypothetical protein